MADNQEDNRNPTPQQTISVAKKMLEEKKEMEEYRIALRERTKACSPDMLNQVKEEVAQAERDLQENEKELRFLMEKINEVANSLKIELASLGDQKEDLAEKKQRMQELSEKLRELATKISDLKSKEELLTLHKSDIEARLNAIRTTQLAEKASFEKLQESINIMRVRCNKLSLEVEKHEGAVKESVDLIRETEEFLEALERDMADLQAELTEERTNLRNIIRRKDRLQDQERSLRQQLADLETQISNLRDEIQRLEIQRSLTLDVPSSGFLFIRWGGKNKQPERDGLTIQINGLLRKLDSAMSDKQHCLGEISKIKEETRATDALIDTTQVRVAKNETVLNNKNQEKNRKEQALVRSREQLHEKRMELRGKELARDMLEDKIVLAEAEKENTSALINSLEAERQTAQTERDNTVQKLSGLTAEFQEVKVEVSDMKRLIGAAEKTVDQLQQSVAEKERKIESLQTDVETRQRKAHHLKEEHELQLGKLKSLELEQSSVIAEESQITKAIKDLSEKLDLLEKASNLDFKQCFGLNKKATKNADKYTKLN